MYLIVCCCFLFASGFASLVYQVTWIRLLGQSLGSTSIAISTVLAAFFLGLALGSFAAERLTRSGRRLDLGLYAALELTIGLSALLLLPALLNLDALLALVPSLGTELALKFALAAALFLVPTVCMGATFPLMATLLTRSGAPLGRLLSYLYAVNTLGAVFGAFVSGFVLIPRLGLDGAVYVAAAINLAVATGAMLLRSRLRTTSAVSPTPEEPTHDTHAPYRWPAALTLLATGFASIAVQVGWTKYLAIFTGSTLYGLSAIISVFLAGLALGSWAISLLIDRVRSPATLVAWLLPALGVALLAAHAGLGQLPQLQLVLNSLPPDATRDAILRFIALSVLLLPPTLIFGALFPVVLRLYCGDLDGVRRRVGEAYAINTVAGIGGSLIAGFVLIPQLGTDVLLQVMTAVLLALTLVWLPSPALTRSTRIGIAAVAALTFAVNLIPGRLDYPGLIASVGYDTRSATGDRPELLFLREGQTGVVSLVSFDGATATLQNNGLNESQISLVDRRRVLVTETLLGLAPVLLHPAPKSAFVLGFGGGITTDLLTQTSLETIKVVELEPAVVDAVRQIPGGPAESLDDPRVSLVFNDARNSLLVDGASYDLIVSQPSHPWLSGSANVFTEQFWQIARGRLNQGGIFSQWVNLFQMDATTLRAIFSAFYGVFDHGFALTNLNSGDLVLIGSPDPLTLSARDIDARLTTPPLDARAEAIGLRSVNDLLWYFGLSRQQALAISASQAPNGDTNILSEVRLAGLRGTPGPDEDPYALLATQRSFDLVPLLGDEAARTIGGFADALLRAGDLEEADIVITRIEAIDPALAASLRHRALLQSADYAEAFALFDSRTDWSEASRRRQAIAQMNLGQWNRARAALTPVPASHAERGLAALIELLSSGNTVPALSLLRAPAWELARTARTLDVPTIGTIAALRALLRSPRIGTDMTTDQLARLLVRASDGMATLLATVEEQAIAEGNSLLAKQAGDALSGLDSDFE